MNIENHNHKYFYIITKISINQNHYIPLYSLLLLQLFICAFGLFQYPLWVDEAYSAILARKSFFEIHNALMYDAGPPLYYDLLHCWRFVFGESEYALRSMSLLFSIITTVILFQFSVSIYNIQYALSVCLFWILSPLQVYYATEVRSYTFLTCLTVCLIYLLYIYVKKQSIIRWLTITLISIALLYTHNTSFYLFPAAIVGLLLYTNNKIIVLRIGMAYLLSFVFYLPWITVLSEQLRNTERIIGWIEVFWTWKMPIYTFAIYTPGGYALPYMDMQGLNQIMQVVMYVIYAVLFLFAIMKARKYNNKSINFICIILTMGLVIPYFLSFISIPTYLAGRTDFYLYPLWIMIIVYGLSSFKNKVYQQILFVTMIIVMVLSTYLIYVTPPVFKETELVKALRYHVDADDIVITTGLTRPIVEYELNDYKATILSYPKDMENHLAHVSEKWYRDNINLQNESKNIVDEALTKLDRHNKIIMVWSDRSINSPLNSYIESKNVSINRYQHPQMGLRKLNEPVSIWIVKHYE